MATVTLTWEIEGIHDGIGVYRSNALATGFELIATLAPNSVTFTDDFLLSQLTAKYGTEPTTLFYKLSAFRGLDVKEGDVVPVPLVDTMPDFLTGKDYLDPVPEVKGTSLATYYTLGSHTIGGNKYHVLAGIHDDDGFFLTDPSTDLPFAAVNQYMRNLPLGAATLQQSIAVTTEAHQQHVLGAGADVNFHALRSLMARTDTVLEVLPSKTIMTQLAPQILALSNAISVPVLYWTSTMESTAVNEFGQMSELSVNRHNADGTADKVSVTTQTSAKAKTLTLMLIDDIN